LSLVSAQIGQIVKCLKKYVKIYWRKLNRHKYSFQEMFGFSHSVPKPVLCFRFRVSSALWLAYTWCLRLHFAWFL